MPRQIVIFGEQLIFYDKNNDCEGSVIHVLEVLLLLVNQNKLILDDRNTNWVNIEF